MASRFGRSRSERSNFVGLLASFAVIAAGFCGAIMLSVVSAPKPGVAIAAAVVGFVAIALVPIAGLRARGKDASRMRVRGPTLSQRIRAWFRRNEQSDRDEPKIWKRRRNRPDSDGVFITEHAEPTPVA